MVEVVEGGRAVLVGPNGCRIVHGFERCEDPRPLIPSVYGIYWGFCERAKYALMVPGSEIDFSKGGPRLLFLPGVPDGIPAEEAIRIGAVRVVA